MTSASPTERPGTHRASKLLHAVLMLNDALENAMCRHLKINETDLQALRHLMLGDPMTPSELAARLHISTAATTAVIDRMSERGHVLRTPHPNDRRSLLIRPSPEATMQTLATLRPLFSDAERCITDMAPAAQDSVVAYLENILDAMNAQIESLYTPALKKRKPRS